MKVVVLYHPKSDHGGTVEDYARDYRMLKDGKELDLVSLETVEGAQMAKLYDVTIYPAVLALADDGSLHDSWQGLPLPLMNEIDAYTVGQSTVGQLPTDKN